MAPAGGGGQTSLPARWMPSPCLQPDPKYLWHVPSRQDWALWCLTETRFSSKLGRSESWGLGRREVREVPALGVSEFRLGAACALLLLGAGLHSCGLEEAAPHWPRIQPAEPEAGLGPLWGTGQCRAQGLGSWKLSYPPESMEMTVSSACRLSEAGVTCALLQMKP